MHIAVCIKEVPNPEAAFAMFKVDGEAKRVIPAAGLQFVMSPFDEQALEAALRIREAAGGAKITAVSIGPERARATLKHALAMGADEALLVTHEALSEAGPEATAATLAQAIRSLGEVDLILTGRQAADWDAGVVGCGLAELLDLPLVTFARKIELAAEGERRTVRVERVLADGFETLEAELPAVVTVSNELGAPRTPNLRETMRAARKPLTLRSAADIGMAQADIERYAARRVRERLFVPEKRVQCEWIEGADEAGKAAELARRLREARLV